ncbi:MAG: hypothetical protein KAG66_24255, partial [Methylococcales bacterium]|nr:hypothetical protein [Methylococcales bacterium]
TLWGEEDFEDGDYTTIDPSLNNGLNWEFISGGTASVYEYVNLPTSMRLRLKSDNTVMLVKGSAQAPSQSSLTAPFSVEFFDAQENHVHDDMGLIFLYQDTLNHYKLEISDTEVAVHRVMGGVETTIGSSTDMKMRFGLDGAKFTLQVEVSPTELTFTVTKSESATYSPEVISPDVETITWSDSNTTALATFKSGRIGFYQFNIPSIFQTPHYDDISITDLMLDLDNDGLDDLWEKTHFSSITVSDGSGDYDGDSLTDGGEFIAGTDPKDAASVFEMLTMALNPANNEITLSWSSVAGRTDSVQSSTTLGTDDWTTVSGLENETATPPSNTATLTPGGSVRQFFKVRVN